MTTKLTYVTKQLKDHVTDLTLLHEGHMHLELNLKMLMTKMGVTPSNTQPAIAPTQTLHTEIEGMNAETTKDSVDEGLDKDFRMTEEVFDKVLEDYSRHRGPPPQKYQKVSTLIDLAEGDKTL